MAIEHDIPAVVNNHLQDHQDNDSECSYMMPITKDELYQELDELLTAFCSDAQQQFCIDQQVIALDDLERIRQTVQQVQTLLPTVDRNNNLQLRRALSRAIHDILQHYGDACQQRNMRLLDEIATNQYIGDWHRLKQQWELKARENQHIFYILDDITLLTQSWLQHHHSMDHNNSTKATSNKHIVPIPSLSSLPHRLSTAKKRASTSIIGTHPLPHPKTTTTATSSIPSASPSPSSSSSTAADILASILTTFDYPAGAYTVMVDKSNYGQLGLDHGKIGTRQIIFDSHQLSSNDIIETVNQICEVFASLFAATAHHHLAQIDAQVRKAQPFYTMTHIKRLAARIFCDGDPATAATSMIAEDMEALDVDKKDDDNGEGGATTHHQHYRHASSSSGHSMSIPPPPRLLASSPSPASSMAVLTPFRLSMSTPHMLWHHPIPIPSFAPAPWQLPDLLKSRHPYNPLFFGLFRRRTSITTTTTTTTATKQSSSLLKRAQHYHQHYHHASPAPMETAMPTKTTSMLRGKKTGAHRSTTPPRPSSTASHATTTTTTATTTGAHDPSEAVFDKPTSRFLQRHSSTLHRPQHEDDNNTKQPVAPFTSVSVDKLSLHLGKMASQFYQDLWMHTRLRYQETQSGLQSLEWQMMDLYRHLQLASSRAVMQRAMMIVQELEDEDGQPPPPPQQQQQEQYGQQRYGTKQYREDDSDTSSDDDYEYPSRTDRWTPICTDKVAIISDSNSSSTTPLPPPPPLMFHSGTTTATTTSSSAASQQAPLGLSCMTDMAPCFDEKETTSSTEAAALVSTESTHSSLPPPPLGDKQSQMQQQQNNPALSITSSFTTAAS